MDKAVGTYLRAMAHRSEARRHVRAALHAAALSAVIGPVYLRLLQAGLPPIHEPLWRWKKGRRPTPSWRHSRATRPSYNYIRAGPEKSARLREASKRKQSPLAAPALSTAGRRFLFQQTAPKRPRSSTHGRYSPANANS